MARPRKPKVHEPEIVPIDSLVEHPENYRVHPPDQISHLVESMREHGFYRNVIVSKDGTILAGHGVVAAAREAGMTEVSVVRMPFPGNDPRAWKILVADNELMRLAEIDDRKLSELLRAVRGDDAAALLGTGYDDAMLANLVLVTRAETEIPGIDHAAAWAGMPSFEEAELAPKVVVTFDSPEDRQRFMETIGVTTIHKNTRGVWSIKWPPREREDLASLRFEDEARA